MISSAGSAVVTAGIGDSINNNATMTAHLDAIVSTGARTAITNSGTLTSTDGRGIVSSGSNAVLTNHETITAHLDAIASSGKHAVITNDKDIISETGAAIASSGKGAIITNSTLLSGYTFGILSSGDDAVITNNSIVTAAGIGLKSTGDHAVITTMAELSGDVALVVSGSASIITNANEIIGMSATAAAIRITSPGETAFTNRATVNAESGIALKAGKGAESILNTGALNGDVLLGGGNDWFSALKGAVTGKVCGGAGNDVYVVGIPLAIRENAGEGTDTVQSKFTYTLGANLENLKLLGSGVMDATGNRLDNVIAGNRGDNHLTGLGGRDIFVFEKGCAQDIVTDFTDHRDRIDLSAYQGIDGFSDIARIKTSGEDVVIVLGGHDRVTIEHFHKSDLSAADFLF
jgi:hypothetical protein